MHQNIPRKSLSSIEILLVEIIHRILDNLDAETILLSVRLVSKLFRSIISTYNRYSLDLSLVSKRNFDLLCRLINPENVISIRISNDECKIDKIGLFIEQVPLEQFTQLRSLTLLHIDESQLQVILLRIKLHLLTFLTFIIRKYDKGNIKITTDLLTSLTNRSNFYKMEFNIDKERLSSIIWPSSNCTIRCLTIGNMIAMDNLIKILQCCPQLHTLILNSIETGINRFPYPCFRQLSSLTIKDLRISIVELESLLFLTPSLVYLKIIGDNMMIIDGKRWEEFITLNLCQLNKFEFYFNNWESTTSRLHEKIESIFSSFQTPFWIEGKKWFITCEYYPKWNYKFDLYSIPICKSSFTYRTSSDKVSLSTYPNNDRLLTDNIHSLTLIMDESLADDIRNKVRYSNHPLYPKVTDIDLKISEIWPLLSLKLLSIFINIPRIVHMKIFGAHLDIFKQRLLVDIDIVLEQACNLS